GFLHERTIGRGLSSEHFLDSQADWSQRVLELVRGLARERLPAGYLREIYEPIAIALVLAGHVIEGCHRAAYLVLPRRLDAPIPVAGREVRQSRRELLNWTADAVRDEDERNHRDNP